MHVQDVIGSMRRDLFPVIGGYPKAARADRSLRTAKEHVGRLPQATFTRCKLVVDRAVRP